MQFNLFLNLYADPAKSYTIFFTMVKLENLTMPALFLSYIFRYQSKIFAFNKHVICIEMRELSFPVFTASML